MLSAVRKGTVWDYLGNAVALFGLWVPHFWLGIMLILWLSVHWHWLPASGYVSPCDNLVENLRRMLMPAFVLGTGLTAVLMRQIRSSILAVLQADYVRTARAKGLAERPVVYKHALRNALIPAVTVLGLQAGASLAAPSSPSKFSSSLALGSTVSTAFLAEITRRCRRLS